MKKADSFHLTDTGNAKRLAQLYSNRIRYDHKRGRWLVWHKHYWQEDKSERIYRLAIEAVRQLYLQSAEVEDLGKRQAVATFAIRSEHRSRLDAAVRLAKTIKPLADSGENWDTNLWLFAVKNGVIDLKTGQLRPGQRNDRITLHSDVEYDPDATCPLWLKFLNRVTAGNAALQSYLQRAVGYSLTGDTTHRILFFLYGIGNNGKTTFTMTIRKLEGSYGEKTSSDVFMTKGRSGPNEGLANLDRKRFAITSEVEEGKRLSTTLIKDVTGGETSKADYKYGHEFEYQPMFKLWMYGNHKPMVTDRTNSIWNRLKLIPFTVTIPDKDIDLSLPKKLEAELPGILAWAVRGCLHWQKYGLKEPDAVMTATASYRRDQDILGDFLEECCVIKSSEVVKARDLYTEYRDWAEGQGLREKDRLTVNSFGRRMGEQFTKFHVEHGSSYRGVGLRQKEHQLQVRHGRLTVNMESE